MMACRMRKPTRSGFCLCRTGGTKRRLYRTGNTKHRRTPPRRRQSDPLSPSLYLRWAIDRSSDLWTFAHRVEELDVLCSRRQHRRSFALESSGSLPVALERELVAAPCKMWPCEGSAIFFLGQHTHLRTLRFL